MLKNACVALVTLVLLAATASAAQAGNVGPDGCSFPGIECQNSAHFTPPADAPAPPSEPFADTRCRTEGANTSCQLESYVFVRTENVYEPCQDAGEYPELKQVLIHWGVFRQTAAEYVNGVLSAYWSQEGAEWGGIAAVLGPCIRPAVPEPSPAPAAPTPAVGSAAVVQPVPLAGGSTVAPDSPDVAVSAPVEAESAPAATVKPLQRLTRTKAADVVTRRLRAKYGKRDYRATCRLASRISSSCYVKAGYNRYTGTVTLKDNGTISVVVGRLR